MCISTLHLCWGAQAGLYFHYGIAKRPLGHKVFGVFSHHTERDNFILFRGFDDIFYIPHSRHTETARQPVNNWRSSGHMIYANWVNCILYQTTPYDITAIGR